MVDAVGGDTKWFGAVLRVHAVAERVVDEVVMDSECGSAV